MYQILTGPVLWFSFLFFAVGCLVHIILYIKGLDWKIDRVTYTKHVSFGIRGAVRSVFYWLVPYGTRSWRVNPGFSLVFFLFHFGLIFTPVFLRAHNLILRERWGISLWSIPDVLADVLTICVMVCALFILLRRVSLPKVRILTSAHDILVLAIAVAPFLTGFIAYNQIGNAPFWTLIHIISGEIMLIAIPLTKLSHVVHFFCSRVQLGIDFGVKRGGMKSAGLNW